MRVPRRLTAAVAAVGIWCAPDADAGARPLRVSDIQAVGTHNSFHVAASPAESTFRRSAGFDDDALAYSHAALAAQLERQGVRQLELDLFADPRGGRYAAPRLRELAGEPAYDKAMREPGTKVLHIQDYDYRSSCLTLVVCLRRVRAWSRGHRRHVPIAILLELKDARLPPGIPATVPLRWTRARIAALDAELRSVFGRDELIVPDDVRGGRPTLRAAVRRDGWPVLERSRGKVLFVLDGTEAQRRRYLAGHPSLTGRVMFTSGSPARPEAAVVQVPDPRGAGGRRIRRLVRRGFLVRTRADRDTVEARRDDRRRAAAAFASGAHWVSTDFPAAGLAAPFGTGYFVALPGGVAARCNPVAAPPSCRVPLERVGTAGS